MTNPNWLSGANMSLLDYHTGPVRNVEPTCNVTEYISNFEDVEWLDATRFAAIEDSLLEVEKCGDFLYCYGSWMIRWRHWVVAPRLIRVTVVADMPCVRTRSELNYVRRMCLIIDDVQRNVFTSEKSPEVDVRLLFKLCNNYYSYSCWTS